MATLPCHVHVYHVNNIAQILKIQLDFADVLAEPSSAHGFDPLWRLSFILFSNTKLWLYRLVSAILVLPLSIIWAAVFAVFTILYVWIIRPTIKIVEVVFAVFKRVSSKELQFRGTTKKIMAMCEVLKNIVTPPPPSPNFTLISGYSRRQNPTDQKTSL